MPLKTKRSRLPARSNGSLSKVRLRRVRQSDMKGAWRKSVQILQLTQCGIQDETESRITRNQDAKG